MILLGNPFSIKGAVVYWRHKPIPQADPATFQSLGGDWGRDADQVFVQAKVKKGIEIATFRFLNPVFVKDANRVYDWTGIIKGADPNTFEVLDSGVLVREGIATTAWVCGFARDSAAVYYHDQMFGRASSVRGAEPGTFVSLRNDYGYDSKSVWYQKKRLSKSDPKSWTYLGRLWSMDRERVYFAEREVIGIDRERFTVVGAPTGGFLATDGNHFFLSDQQVSEQEFWTRVVEDFGTFENAFRVAYHRIQKTCSTCNGSGSCYCKRKGIAETEQCARCGGAGKCHICKGNGRL